MEVKDGQLNLDFRARTGPAPSRRSSSIPTRRPLKAGGSWTSSKARRRFHFDNYFKRILHRPTGEPPARTDAERARGFVVFQRDWMQDVFYNDRPLPGERVDRLTAAAFAGEYEPVTLAVVPLQDLGRVTVTASDLKGPGASIPGRGHRRRLCLLPPLAGHDGRHRLYDRAALIMPRWRWPCRRTSPAGSGSR